MALAATAAKLLASLDLDTKPFERGAKRVGVAMGGMERRFGKIGGMAQRGVANMATNFARIGVVAAGAIAVAVRSGIQSLADLERVQNATAGVIESTGGKAGVSAEQVRALAESLESLTTADDKVIQSGENLLLTFTGIGKDVFPQATKAMVDLGIAMAQGDVANADFKTSAIQIGKALQDPILGMTALRRSGVSFTEQQKDQIKALVKSGDVMGAQKLILAELETEFGKAGEAAGKGFGGDLRRLDDASEDTRMALATGFLPVISKVAKFLQAELVKPETQRQIREFGDTLAGAFDKLLQIGGKLPWDAIGNSLKIAGAGAKALFDAFTMLPPWVQTAVLTGWGLNKLSGGMLGGIVGELGKGLIKGVLGIQAGVVNVNAGAVRGGGVPGGAVPVGAKGGIGALGKLFLVGEAIGLVAAVKGVADQIGADAKAQTADIQTSLTESLAGKPTVAQLQMKLDAINTGLDRLPRDPIGAAIFAESIAEMQRMRAEVVEAIYGRSEDRRGDVDWSKFTTPIKSLENQTDRVRQSSDRVITGVEKTKGAIDWSRQATVTRLEALGMDERAGFAKVREAAEANRIATVDSRGAIVSAIGKLGLEQIQKRTLRGYGKSESKRGSVDWSKFEKPINRLERKNARIITSVERLRDVALRPPMSAGERAALARIERKNERIVTGVERAKSAIDWSKLAVDSGTRATERAKAAIDAARQTTAQVRSATQTGTDRIVAAIHGIDLRAQVTVNGYTYGANPGQPTNQTRNRRPRRPRSRQAPPSYSGMGGH